MTLGCRLDMFPKNGFTPITNQDIKPALKNRLATHSDHNLGRLFDVPIPSPEPVSLDQAVIIAQWVAEIQKSTALA